MPLPALAVGGYYAVLAVAALLGLGGGAVLVDEVPTLPDFDELDLMPGLPAIPDFDNGTVDPNTGLVLITPTPTVVDGDGLPDAFEITTPSYGFSGSSTYRFVNEFDYKYMNVHKVSYDSKAMAYSAYLTALGLAANNGGFRWDPDLLPDLPEEEFLPDGSPIGSIQVGAYLEESYHFTTYFVIAFAIMGASMIVINRLRH